MVYDLRIDGFPATVDLRPQTKDSEKKCTCAPCVTAESNSGIVEFAIADDNSAKKTPRCFDCL